MTANCAGVIDMCLYPIDLYVNDKSKILWYDTETGKPVYATMPVTVACGKCVECLQKYSEEWSFRIMGEASLYRDNCFITLTYNNEHLPDNGTLVKRDFQLFIKSLRERLAPFRIRYFGCGEYGKKGLRPHYHIIIFNWKPSDLMFWKRDRSGVDLFRSRFIESIWKYGYSSVGALSLKSAKYCAKYMQKLNDVKPGCIKPFLLMSTHPGIGYDTIKKSMLDYDKIYFDGKSFHIPRYYLKVLERDGFDLTDFIKRRCEVGKLYESADRLRERRKKAKNFVKKVDIHVRLC